jgi:hypothetical protein
MERLYRRARQGRSMEKSTPTAIFRSPAARYRHVLRVSEAVEPRRDRLWMHYLERGPVVDHPIAGELPAIRRYLAIPAGSLPWSAPVLRHCCGFAHDDKGDLTKPSSRAGSCCATPTRWKVPFSTFA